MNNLNMIIGVSGVAGSGKTTTTKRLTAAIELCPYTLAEPVTRACAAAYNVEHRLFLAMNKNSVIPNTEITVREAMQKMGRMLRSVNKNILIAQLENRAAMNEQSNYLFNGMIVSDIRMPHEAEWVRRKGGTVVHVRKNNTTETPTDETEQELPAFAEDFEVDNNGDLNHLYSQIHGVGQEIKNQAIRKTALSAR